MAVDTLGLLLALHLTPADEQERAQVGKLVEEVQAVTNESVKVCFADQGYTGDFPAQAAKEAGHSIDCRQIAGCRRTDSFCCRNDGLLSAASLGLPVSVDWHETLNAPRKS